MLLAGGAAAVGAAVGSRKMSDGTIGDGTVQKAFGLLLLIVAAKLAMDFWSMKPA